MLKLFGTTINNKYLKLLTVMIIKKSKHMRDKLEKISYKSKKYPSAT